MADRRIALGIDASGATVGAEEYRRAMEIVRAHNRNAVEGVREVERSMGRAGDVGSKSAQALAASMQRAGTVFAASGGDIRGAVSGILSELLAAAIAAQGAGDAISGSLDAAKLGLSRGGGLRTEVATISEELDAASSGANLLAQSLRTAGNSAAAVTVVGSAAAAAEVGIKAATISARDLSRTLATETPQAVRSFYNTIASGFSEVDRKQDAVLNKTQRVVSLLRNVPPAKQILRPFGAGVFDPDASPGFGAGVFAPAQRPQLRFGYGVTPAVDLKRLELPKAVDDAKNLDAALGGVAARIGGISALGASILAVGAGIGIGVKNALELERSLALVAARTPTGNILPYEAASLDLSRQLGVDDITASKAFRSAQLSGFSEYGKQIEVVTLGLKLMKTEGVDAAAAVALIDGALDAYGKNADQAYRITNQLLSATHAGETSFEDMARGVAQVGAVASPLGVELEDVASVLATIAPKVGGASQAASGLSNLLLQLSDSTSVVNQELRKNGIEIDANAIRTKGLAVTLAEVGRGLEGKEALLAQVFGSPRIARVALASIEDGGERSRQVLEKIRGEVDLLNESFAKIKDLPTEKLERAKATASSLFTQAGQGLTDIFDFQATLAVELGEKLGLAAKEAIGGAVAEAQKLSGIASSVQAVAFFDKDEEERLRGVREEAERIAFLKIQATLKQGLIPDPGIQGPNLPPPRPQNLPSATSPLGPEFDKELGRAREEAESLSTTLREKLAGALELELSRMEGSENATRRFKASIESLTLSLRGGENEIRKKIASYEALGVPTDELQAQLFALVNANDATIRSMRESHHAVRLAADSHERAGIAALAYSQAQMRLRGTTVSIGAAHWAAIQGVKALTEAIMERVVAGQKSFDSGIGQNVKDYQFQVSLIGKTAEEQERLTAYRQFDLDAMRLLAETSPEVYNLMIDDIQAAQDALDQALDDKVIRARADAIGHAIADPIGQGLDAWIQGLSTWEDAVESTVRSIIAQLARVNLINPLQQGILGLFGGGGPATSSMGNVVGPGGIDEQYAMGGVPGRHFDIQPSIRAIRYEHGGIPDLINQPTLSPIRPTIARFAFGGLPGLTDLPDLGSQPAMFGMGGGRTGSIREGGKEEAILPVLARAGTGELGVKLVGGSPKSQGSTTTIVKHFNIDVRLDNPGNERSRRQMVDDLHRMSQRD